MNEAKASKDRWYLRGRTWVPVLVAMVVIVLAGIMVDRQAQVIAESRMRSNALAQIAVIRAKLEGNISSNIQLVRGLVSTISTEPNMNQVRFSALARNLFENDSQLRSVAAAPDLVIRMTYPFEANKAAIGVDYRTVPTQWDAVKKVMDTGHLVMAGPVELVQGGRGFIGRFPVYVGMGADRNFWGIVSAVVDVDRLYADSGLMDAKLPLNISITGMDGTGETGTRFFGPDLTRSSPVTAEVVLPSGTWQIAAVPKGGWDRDTGSLATTRLLIVFGGLLILLPIVMTARMVDERHVHIDAIREREATLSRLTRRLNLALAASKIGVWEMELQTGEEVWDERTNELHGRLDAVGPRKHSDWYASVHPEDRDRAEHDFRSMIACGRYESDYRIIHADGTVRHVRSMGASYRDPDGVDRVVGVNWDVTADVTLTEDLRRARDLAEARNDELEQARVSIEYNALHDSLTGLPNRRYLDEMLSRSAASGHRGSGSIALLHIDLDRFKQINDTLGHAAGDAMLVHASSVLRQNTDSEDFVARIGGDEFVIVSTAGEHDAQLSALAERIVVEMRKPIVHMGHECRCGVSIGVAASRGSDLDVKQLLVNADIALYRAKARGRNRFEYFSDMLQAEVIKTKRLADDILDGIDRRAFLAHYQPQFCARTHALVGVEALARWQHPTQGLKSPDAFMAVAEELSVVASIDRMILEGTLEDLRRWDGLGLGIPKASVNVSLRRLNDEGLIDSLRQLGIAPGRLAFELIESIYLDERDGMVGWNIDQIKDMGIDIEIDDFGTGYASIVSLQKLRPNRLKIDRQLVMPILNEPAQRRLVSSIVDIGKSMGIEIVAEGVETMEHAAILKDLGADILQGFAFARPMAAPDLEAFVTEQRWRRAV